MLDSLESGLTWYAIVGSAIMAGIFFSFSVFMMRAFDNLGPANGIAAMQQTNRTILNPLFMLAFMGTTLAALGIGVLALRNLDERSAQFALAGAGIFVVGNFLVTLIVNVPKNNALDALDPTLAGSAAAWKNYVSSWTAWNHVRTVSCLAALVLFVLALRD
jgi:uncharacterized membrane protein